MVHSRPRPEGRDRIVDADQSEREQLRQALADRGFARAGFTGADPVQGELQAWLAAGRHASMEWMTRTPERRADPRALLPGARTVICAAAAYPPTDARGAIAGYARAEDYHRTLRAALADVAKLLEARWPGCHTRVCTDSEPLLERALAARAGLGWIGRNTMLLDESHGPWMLLGEILTDVAFPPDAPVAERCGTCTACVQACPTGALDGARGLDARRCLSYWSIEHRGPLPEEWARALGHRVFGCDDCLTACPFPARAAPPPPERADAPWQARPDLVAAAPAELQARAQESFRRHFSSTPVERARRTGLLRNAAAAQANAAAAPPDGCSPG
jgi:epoxyqueuosine reductase